MSYHNLCRRLNPPAGAGKLLGLGLKFCLQSCKPDNKVLEHSLKQFERDVRIKYTFAGEDSEMCDPKIYIKSDWDPDPLQNNTVESCLLDFRQTLTTQRIHHIGQLRKATNLSRIQKKLLRQLRQNTDFICLMTDKNLGPALMERKEYIEHILAEHLLQGSMYSYLTQEMAELRIEKLKQDIIKIITDEEMREHFTEDERDYFTCSLSLKSKKGHRVPKFYGTPKVHKLMIPHVKFRPVVSQCGSISAIVSVFLDYKLQAFTPYVPSYLKNSYALIKKLKKLGKVAGNAKVFTSDATSMYSNITLEEGMETVELYLKEYIHELPVKHSFEVDTIMKLFRLVMANNVFQFGETWWLQLIGTAMGTPCAPIYATLFFAWFERQFISK